jgi:hypothetical protein
MSHKLIHLPFKQHRPWFDYIKTYVSNLESTMAYHPDALSIETLENYMPLMNVTTVSQYGSTPVYYYNPWIEDKGLDGVLSLPPTQANLDNHDCARFCVISDKLPEKIMILVLFNLLSNRRLVIISATNPLVEKYRHVCIVCKDIFSKAKELLTLGVTECKTLIPYPDEVPSTTPFQESVLHQHNVVKTSHKDFPICQEGDDYFQIFTLALSEVDDEGSQRLKLSPPRGVDSLPSLLVLCTNHNSSIDLHHRNRLDTRYPSTKITYMVTDNLLDTLSSINQEEYPIVAIQASDHYYLPHSLYAKVKLLQDHPDKEAVISTHELTYNLKHNRTVVLPEMTNMERYQNADEMFSLWTGLYKTSWLRRLDPRWPANHRKALVGHKHQIINIPINFNCLRISLSDEMEKGKTISSLFDFSTKIFFNNLYRSRVGILEK